MSTRDITTEAFANTRPGADALPDYAPVPRSAPLRTSDVGPSLHLR